MKSYGADSIESGKLPFEPEICRVIRVSLNPSLLKELTDRLLDHPIPNASMGNAEEPTPKLVIHAA